MIPSRRKKRARPISDTSLSRSNFSHGFDLEHNSSTRLHSSDPSSPTHSSTMLRVLSPYFHKYPSYVKQRWRGRAILEVFSTDFDSHNEDYFKKAIELGLITVNSEKVSCTYRLCDGDYIVHLLHRHEPAVNGDPIEILVPEKKDSSIFAVLKPGGISVHPCGPHQYLSLLALLARDSYDIRDLHPVHRLDRLTSGIVLMAKGKEAASKMSAQFRGEFGGVRKRYIAIVEGKFPLAPNSVDGKMCGSIFDASCGAKSVIEFIQTTTTTILKKGDELNDNDNNCLADTRLIMKLPNLSSMDLKPLDPPTCAWINSFKPQEIIAYADEGVVDKKKESDVTFIDQPVKIPEMKERHFQKVETISESNTSLVASSLPDISWVKRSLDGPAYLRVSVAIRTTDQKNALQTVSSTSSITNNNVYKGDPFSSVGADKESVTLFRRIACVKRLSDKSNSGIINENDDSYLSLIEIIPLSGRTHQIRLHTAWLGFPIEDDVVYSRRAYTKLLHMDMNSIQSSSASSRQVIPSSEKDVALTSEEISAMSLCVYCAKGAEAEFTAVQRKADGICLHSCEYEGGIDKSEDSWHVKAPLPNWIEQILSRTSLE